VAAEPSRAGAERGWSDTSWPGGVAHRTGQAGCLRFTNMTVLICSIVLVSTFWAVAAACLLLTLALGRDGGAEGADGQADH
jgi:hypothetical protein